MLIKVFLMLTLAIVLYLQSYFIKIIISPANLYLWWSAFLLSFSVLFLYPNIEWNGVGVVWWIISCVVFSIGNYLGYKKLRFRRRGLYTLKVSAPFLEKTILVLYFLMGIMYTVLLLTKNGFSVLSMRNLSYVYTVNNYMQGHRYGHESLGESSFQQICLSFTYGLPLCAGYLLPTCHKNRDKIFAFCSFIPNLLITFTNNTKTGTIFAVMLFVCAYVIGYIDYYRHLPAISVKVLLRIVPLLVVFIFLMFLAIGLRYNSNSSLRSVNHLLMVMRDYIFGCTVNFDRNFMIYGVSTNYNNLELSNIHTANATWIMQYGRIGTLLFWLLRGVVSGLALKNLLNGKADVIDKALLIYCYINAWYFFIYIPFSYLTVTIGVFLWFPLFLLIHGRGGTSEKERKVVEL